MLHIINPPKKPGIQEKTVYVSMSSSVKTYPPKKKLHKYMYMERYSHSKKNQQPTDEEKRPSTWQSSTGHFWHEVQVAGTSFHLLLKQNTKQKKVMKCKKNEDMCTKWKEGKAPDQEDPQS